ncbi:MAG: hypothetical protein H7Y36_04095 [Armatimonadetes bacterium]|nr:hypothetical protein [Akkermansiaceae bacterium]
MNSTDEGADGTKPDHRIRETGGLVGGMNVRMTKFRLTVIIVITVMAVVFGHWLYRDSPWSHGGRRLFGQGDGTTGGQSDSTNSRHGRYRDCPAESPALLALKERWKAIAPSLRTGIITQEHRQLAHDSIETLLCGSETLELIKFMENHELVSGVSLLNNAVSELLRSPRAAEARTSLIVALKEGDVVQTNDNPLEQWCYEAGRGCPDDELKQFCAEIENPSFVLSALLGRNLAMADTDARKAVSSTLTLLAEKGNRCGMDGQSLCDQIAKLPSDSDFQEIERLFPVESEEDRTAYSPIWSGYGILFTRWAREDPAAAANYVMANSERVGAEKITVIAATVARGDPLAALDWVQNFPDGAYFDQAAFGVIAYIKDAHLKEALELAALISDPKLREEAIKRTKIK